MFLKAGPGLRKHFSPQSQCLDVPFRRGRVPYLGRPALGVPCALSRAWAAAASEAVGAGVGPLQEGGRARGRSPASRQHKGSRAHTHPSPDPNPSCSPRPQTPLCDRFLDSPTDPPHFRSLPQESATSSGQKPFPDERPGRESDSRQGKGVT